jgi:branched-subunit amino acid transport protein
VSALTLVLIALITYASRAIAVVLLPRPSARFETILARIPAAIFASLATATLLGEGGALPGPPVLGAAAGALLASPARALLPVLIGGAVGYAAGLFF